MAGNGPLTVYYLYNLGLNLFIQNVCVVVPVNGTRKLKALLMAYNDQLHQNKAVSLTSIVVLAYISRNKLLPGDLPKLITGVYQAFSGLGNTSQSDVIETPKATATQIRKSITADGLVSFEDGKNYQILRRHLTNLGLSPDAYRAKWGLPFDYPMTASSYSSRRSELAHSFGLGQSRTKAVASVTPDADPTTARRGRPKKADQSIAAE